MVGIIIFLLTFTYVNAQSCKINIFTTRIDINFCVDGTSSCTSLLIVSYNLRVIPSELEKCYPNITMLDLKQCQIDTTEGSLRHAKLKTLNLSGNKLTLLNYDDFSGFKALEILDLSFNEIMNLQFAAFNGIKLKILRLNNNRIHSIEPERNDVINYCNFFIEILDLKNNILENVEYLGKLSVLRILDLSNNSKLRVDTFPFSRMNKMHTLKLNNVNLNDVKELDLLKHASNLRNLSIAQNQFRPLDFSLFPQMERLEYININNVKFVHHENLKKRLPNMKFIKMTSHSWTCDFFNVMLDYVEDNSITWLNKPRYGSNCNPNSQRTLLASILLHLELIVLVVLSIIGILMEWVLVIGTGFQITGQYHAQPVPEQSKFEPEYADIGEGWDFKDDLTDLAEDK